MICCSPTLQLSSNLRPGCSSRPRFVKIIACCQLLTWIPFIHPPFPFPSAHLHPAHLADHAKGPVVSLPVVLCHLAQAVAQVHAVPRSSSVPACEISSCLLCAFAVRTVLFSVITHIGSQADIVVHPHPIFTPILEEEQRKGFQTWGHKVSPQTARPLILSANSVHCPTLLLRPSSSDSSGLDGSGLRDFAVAATSATEGIGNT
jgi:hypothetical protein